MSEMLLNGRLYGANGVMEITQAQYDALPASKLTDGVLYCIKDTGIVEGDKYAPIIYSLEEREVGVYIDGKPLYQKTIHKTYSQLSSYGNYMKGFPLNEGDENKNILNAYGIAISPNYGWCFLGCQDYAAENDPSYYWSLNIYYGAIIAHHNKDIVNSAYLDAVAPDLYITVRYTKTTDVSGSGTWGTDGVPMVHYDGNEKVIGTWFGETLYQKTIHKTNVAPSSSDTVLVLASEISPNLDSVHHIEGMFGRMQVNSSPYGTDGYNVVWGTGSTYYHYNWYNENASHVWLTYQYTKTT